MSSLNTAANQSEIRYRAMETMELMSNEKGFRSLVQTWKEGRKARREGVKLAIDVASQLDAYAAQVADENSDNTLSPGGIPQRQTPGRARLASGPRVRNRRPISGNSEVKCKYTRHSIKIDCWITIKVADPPSSDKQSTVSVKWFQHITQIRRTLELSARNIIGAKLDSGRSHRVTLHCLTSPSSPLGPDSTCDHEQHEFEFDDAETARRCADSMEQVARAILPCAMGERILFVVNPVRHHV
jgi:hypothetical protein